MRLQLSIELKGNSLIVSEARLSTIFFFQFCIDFALFVKVFLQCQIEHFDQLEMHQRPMSLRMNDRRI